MEVVSGYGMIGRGIVFSDFVWANVSERYLRVYRILLDHHHVLEPSVLCTCHKSGVGGSEIGLAYIDGAVSEGRHLRIFDVVDS